MSEPGPFLRLFNKPSWIILPIIYLIFLLSYFLFAPVELKEYFAGIRMDPAIQYPYSAAFGAIAGYITGQAVPVFFAFAFLRWLGQRLGGKTGETIGVLLVLVFVVITIYANYFF